MKKRLHKIVIKAKGKRVISRFFYWKRHKEKWVRIRTEKRERQKKLVPLPLSHSFLKKARNTISRATPAMSPISIASVFSISSSLLLSSSTEQKDNKMV